MPFSIRPYRRFPVQCSVTYNAGPFFKLPLAYVFGFWSLITFLVLSSGPAYAEWVAIGEINDSIVYVDPDTIRRKGDLAKMWILNDFKTIRTVEDASYLSRLAQTQYHCAEERVRQLAVSLHSGNMGKGNTTWTNSDESKWEPVAPRTVGHALWELACRKQ